jgi:hypothetical protein
MTEPLPADIVSYCLFCSIIYKGALEVCPEGHPVAAIDMNSPVMRAFREALRAAREIEREKTTEHQPIIMLSPDGTGIRSLFGCSCGEGPKTGVETGSEMADWYFEHAAALGVLIETVDLSAAVHGPGYPATGLTWQQWYTQHSDTDPFTGKPNKIRRGT